MLLTPQPSLPHQISAGDPVPQNQEGLTDHNGIAPQPQQKPTKKIVLK